MIFQFIEEYQQEFRVVKMCKVLEVSSSGYYKWIEEKEKRKIIHEEKERMDQLIRQSFIESQETYGSPRIARELKARGIPVCERTIGKRMKEMGLRATPKTPYVVTTDSNHKYPIYPNLLERQFMVDTPNTVWVTDITYIWTMQGWLYLASVMDLFSRKIVGWSIAATMKKELPLEALKQAIMLREPGEGLIHHSDRGAQYCSNEYRELLNERKMKGSMSRKGDPYDNACIESFHATIKKELIYRFKWETREGAIQAIRHYIDQFYNTRRRHSTLGYESPVDFEKAYSKSLLLAAG
ncbi:IS3 family transposase [Psychrobacillus sp. NPDC096389]|uniref:IS3 family transposase n=1 Tax=Psychrobacillus sp. NPDC096389 TaxID=3364490 RepID=UPI003823ED61